MTLMCFNNENWKKNESFQSVSDTFFVLCFFSRLQSNGNYFPLIQNFQFVMKIHFSKYHFNAASLENFEWGWIFIEIKIQYEVSQYLIIYWLKKKLIVDKWKSTPEFIISSIFLDLIVIGNSHLLYSYKKLPYLGRIRFKTHFCIMENKQIS